jgi:hypothetical protein
MHRASRFALNSVTSGNDGLHIHVARANANGQARAGGRETLCRARPHRFRRRATRPRGAVDFCSLRHQCLLPSSYGMRRCGKCAPYDELTGRGV